MSGGPFREPRPVDRSVSGRPVNRAQVQQQAAYRHPEEPQPVHRSADDSDEYEQPSSSGHRKPPVRPSEHNKAPKRFKLPVLIIGGVIVVALLGWLLWSGFQNSKTAIDSSKYQAVFFTNGQVYFGKLESFNGDYMKLQDVFYLQGQKTDDGESSNPQQEATNSNDVQLIKLGEEIHGPEDEMIISKEQVLFYENLKADGKVAQSIDQYNESN